jgi:hypothetical protein
VLWSWDTRLDHRDDGGRTQHLGDACRQLVGEVCGRDERLLVSSWATDGVAPSTPKSGQTTLTQRPACPMLVAVCSQEISLKAHQVKERNGREH